MTELEKKQNGMWYDANYDETLVELRRQAQNKCLRLSTLERGTQEANDLIDEILGYHPDHLDLIYPFMCDYGENIHLGSYVFINTNCYLMDCADITIGNHTFIGPYCGVYTATHPINYQERNKGLEKALPVTIGDNCWLGANVSIMPGVSVGNNVVIAAGAVVTQDVPDNTMVAGVPAKKIKDIENDVN